MTNPDPESVARIIAEVAQEEILPRFQMLAEHESWEKKPGSVVTVADHAAEAALISRLTALSPGSVAVGEEGVHDDPRLLDALGEEAPVWLIDAIDGTANFAAGRRPFAVMVAWTMAGVTRMGWIHDPIAQRTIVAEEGSGAFIGDRRLHVADARPFAEMSGVLSGPPRRDLALTAKFENLVHVRCVAENYAGLVLGELDFAHYRTMWPWDHASGVLAYDEAGGYGRDMTGMPYRPAGDRQTQGLLLAPDQDCWHALADLIRAATPPPQ